MISGPSRPWVAHIMLDYLILTWKPFLIRDLFNDSEY